MQSIFYSSNSPPIFQTPEPPSFSIDGGIYPQPFELELSANTGSRIYYTLDGSDPNETSILYQRPIQIQNYDSSTNKYAERDDFAAYVYYIPRDPVPKCMVIKAVSINALGDRSEIITKSYFVDSNVTKSQNMLTVSLTSDPSNLFDYRNGIYVNGINFSFDENDPIQSYANYRLRGKKSRREANLEIYDISGRQLCNQAVEIKIHGGTTRGMVQKSFTLYLNEPKANDCSGSPLDLFDGNQFVDTMYLYNDRELTKTKRAVNQLAVKERNVSTQQFIYCNLFLDGEYWGIYSLTEAYTENYFGNHYSIAPDNIEILDSANPPDVMEWIQDGADLSKDGVWEQFCEMVDIDSLIDYYAAMIYINCQDWLPHNAKIWRSKTAGEKEFEDNKWRWIIYDTELSVSNPDENTFITGNVSTFHEDLLINNCMKNEYFRHAFVNRLLDLMNNNFSESSINGVIDDVVCNVKTSFPFQCERFCSTMEDFDNRIETMRDYFKERPAFIVKYIKDEFSLKGTPEKITISSNETEGGTITVNSSPIKLNNNSWRGIYYTDFPIEITAAPHEGYQFIGWEGAVTGTDKTINLFVSDGVEILARFERQ